ncbi:hypothetical protein ABH930_005802 [Kitasatospora sp. GAS204A]|uniref:DUF4259 domain-containing protein n=1 Tax=unclassified Kitasatospora TaxID=2633591 RepID=UPI002474A69E|nr:DUF4259 domain-containing protein [Kitasatospora sp. GAS204B]MDH6121171.1 hypothetical protein [Kitasatospora sp. GAS204B]
MGTWDIGPFDNDTAADFSGRLDAAALAERPGLLRAVLELAIAADRYLESDEAEEAVAAAALVAAQRRGGEPIDPAYAPRAPIQVLGPEFDGLALQALDRVTGPGSELAELWGDSGEESRWRERLARLRAVLDGVAR